MIDHGQALKIGSVLHEFRIEKILGEGGFGLTYLAFDENLEKHVAIKEYLPIDFAIRTEGNTVVPRTESSKDDFNWGLNAFLDEARILAKFDHPNIVRISRFFKVNGTAYIVMEYVEGRTLGTTIEELKKLTEEEMLAILGPLIDGLKQVHQQSFFHRDIKPDNIILRDNGSPVLIDFGAARQAIGGKSRSITTIVTPGYAPIEQYSSKGKLGAWTDIYALAAVAYTCLTGSRPDDASDRVVEDEVISLIDIDCVEGGADFLSAIDNALTIKAQERPQTLELWWDKLTKNLHNAEPVVKKKIPKLSPVKERPIDTSLLQDYISITEFSKIKGITEDKVIKMIQDGFYRGITKNGQWYAHLSEVDENYVKSVKPKQAKKNNSKKTKDEFWLDYISIEEFAKIKQIPEKRIIEMIKDGFYRGNIKEGEWFVHRQEVNASDEKNESLGNWVSFFFWPFILIFGYWVFLS